VNPPASFFFATAIMLGFPVASGEAEDADDLDSDEFLRAVAHAPDTAAPHPASGRGSVTEALERIGHYKIEEKIGRGGMGIVYRAEDEKLKRIVALKVLPRDFDEDDHRRKRFLREARVAAAIAHPNVATIHEVGEADGRIYIAMELAAGTTLRARLEKGALSVAETLRIGKDIARGVGKAHARGIAHRDLKPDNVMVSPDGAVKVLDFGLAKPMDDPKPEEQVTVTQEGRIVGTPGYMSPEQATGRTVDVRTDVFALGVILYEMVTGTRPFKGQTSMDALIATSRDAYVPASKLAKIPPSLDQLIKKCLEKEPSDRPASATEVLTALDAVDVAAKKKPLLAYVLVGLGASGLAVWALASSHPAPPAANANPTPNASPSPSPSATADPTPTAATPTTSASAAAVAAPAASSAVRPTPAPTLPYHVVAAGVTVPKPPVASPPSAAPVVATPPSGAPGGVIERSPY
jgi:serine/threonine-protein kinase